MLQLGSQVVDPHKIYRASWPRQLMVRPQFVLEHFNRHYRKAAKTVIRAGGNEWISIEEGGRNDWYLATAKYLAVSYR
jgi:hypothetical protein